MTMRAQLRNTAIKLKHDTFIWDCARHGPSIHDTHLGSCTLCHTELVTLSPRLRALNSGAFFYNDACPDHGLTEFHTRRAICSLCFDSRGRSLAGKAANRSERARARLAGQTTYVYDCPRHGATLHSVLRGRCLTCYTSAGTPRKAFVVPAPPL